MFYIQDLTIRRYLKETFIQLEIEKHERFLSNAMLFLKESWFLINQDGNAYVYRALIKNTSFTKALLDDLPYFNKAFIHIPNFNNLILNLQANRIKSGVK